MSAHGTYPIALAHGFARFDALREFFVSSPKNPFSRLISRILAALRARGKETDKLHYFRGVGSFLEADGFTVRPTSVGFAESVEQRAAKLKAELERVLKETGARKVHVIAHSMGGLDSRYAITKLGMAERVASLTTVGTPHHGSSFADFKQENKLRRELIETIDRVIDVGGLASLTTRECAKFNREARHAEATNGVFYQVYSAHQERKDVFTLLQGSWEVIDGAERDGGGNDGLVSVRSQEWEAELRGDGGEVKKIERRKFPLPADHLNECGWWDLREGIGSRDKFEEAVKRVYLGIAKDLRARFPA
jgi:triacylglycerol lipase